MHLPSKLASTAFLFLFLCGIWLTAPNENLLGNWDPGVYLALGTATTQLGTITDTAAQYLSDEARAEIYPRQRAERVKVPGFYAPFDQKGRLTPQFAPLYPALLRSAHRIGGLSLNLRLDALLYLAGLSLLLLITRKQGLSPIFLLAFAALQPATHWFARFHTSESLAFALFCLLLFAGTGLLRFPIIGKTGLNSSNHWKKSPFSFQSLENSFRPPPGLSRWSQRWLRNSSEPLQEPEVSENVAVYPTRSRQAQENAPQDVGVPNATSLRKTPPFVASLVASLVDYKLLMLRVIDKARDKAHDKDCVAKTLKLVPLRPVPQTAGLNLRGRLSTMGA